EGVPGIRSGKLANGVASYGIGDLRLIPKVNVLDKDGLRIGISAALVLPTGNADAFLSSGFSVQPRVLLDYTLGAARASGDGGLRLLVNVGINVRPSTERFVNLTLGNEFTFGAGVEVP